MLFDSLNHPPTDTTSSVPPTTNTQNRLRHNRVVSVEGNLGSGKTTFLKFLSQRFPEFTLMKQPVEEWQNIQGHNLLELFYKNIKRWSFTFQTYALYSRMRLWKKHEQEEPNTLKLSERSMAADRNIFGNIMGDLNNVEPVELEVYRQITDDILSEWPLEGIIYLRCQPQTCLDRIKKRNRFEEEEVPIEYLQRVHEKHEEWIIREKRVLIIDTDKYDVTCPADQTRIAALVTEFLRSLN